MIGEINLNYWRKTPLPNAETRQTCFMKYNSCFIMATQQLIKKIGKIRFSAVHEAVLFLNPLS